MCKIEHARKFQLPVREIDYSWITDLHGIQSKVPSYLIIPKNTFYIRIVHAKYLHLPRVISMVLL